MVLDMVTPFKPDCPGTVTVLVGDCPRLEPMVLKGVANGPRRSSRELCGYLTIVGDKTCTDRYADRVHASCLHVSMRERRCRLSTRIGSR